LFVNRVVQPAPEKPANPWRENPVYNADYRKYTKHDHHPEGQGDGIKHWLD